MSSKKRSYLHMRDQMSLATASKIWFCSASDGDRGHSIHGFYLVHMQSYHQAVVPAEPRGCGALHIVSALTMRWCHAMYGSCYVQAEAEKIWYARLERGSVSDRLSYICSILLLLLRARIYSAHYIYHSQSHDQDITRLLFHNLRYHHYTNNEVLTCRRPRPRLLRHRRTFRLHRYPQLRRLRNKNERGQGRQ